MKRLNWRIILSNLAEAREQIEAIEDRVNAGEKLNEVNCKFCSSMPTTTSISPGMRDTDPTNSIQG